jgi:signal transduction histidine kinase
LWLLSGDELVLLRSLGFPEAAVARYAKIDVDGPAPLADSIRRRHPVFLESRADYAERYAASESRARDLALDAVQGIACLPLLGGAEPIGGLAFAFPAEKQLEDEERRFLMVLADHASLALQRARLYEAERLARAETELLYTLVDATSRAPTLSAVHDAALDALTAALGAERVAILFSGDSDGMRFVARRGLSDHHVFEAEARGTIVPDVPEPRPVLYEDARNDDRLAAWRELLEREDIGAVAFIPLVDRGRLIGKLMAYFSEPRGFSNDEIRLARTIASHAAEAIGRKRAEAEIVRLLEHSEAARVVAEDAAVSREHLLALVAHDLRNLLHAAEMRTSLALRRVRALGGGPELCDDLGIIQRSAEGMSRLIGDLLDAAAIQAGNLSIQLRDVELGTLFSDALEVARSLGAERDIAIRGEISDGESTVRCDRERILQVIANLVGNAVKFSPRGAGVLIEARRADGEVRFEVRDRGAGIAADQLDRVFDRYFKGEGGRPGVGLGLYISKGLVEAQGGRIWVESAPGVGTSVFVALPG